MVWRRIDKKTWRLRKSKGEEIILTEKGNLRLPIYDILVLSYFKGYKNKIKTRHFNVDIIPIRENNESNKENAKKVLHILINSNPSRIEILDERYEKLHELKTQRFDYDMLMKIIKRGNFYENLPASVKTGIGKCDDKEILKAIKIEIDFLDEQIINLKQLIS